MTTNIIVQSVQVVAFLEAMEMMMDGHYDQAMMMPNAQECAKVQQIFVNLQLADKYPAVLKLDSSTRLNFGQLLWWACREALWDDELAGQALEDLDCLLAVQSDSLS